MILRIPEDSDDITKLPKMVMEETELDEMIPKKYYEPLVKDGKVIIKKGSKRHDK